VETEIKTMKPMYPLTMFVLVLILGLYVFYFERGPVPAPIPSPKPHILRFDPSAVTRLAVFDGRRKTSLHRVKPELWRLETPRVEAIDQARVKAFLQQLSDWSAIQVLEPALAQTRYSEFGLAPPELTLQLETPAARHEVKIGRQTPIRSGYYVLGPDGRQLLLSYVNIPEELERFLSRPPVMSAAKP
jgi:hypothetical protein